MPPAKRAPYDLPGFTVPLDPLHDVYYRDKFFPVALDCEDIEGGYCGYIYTVRELLMMRIMEAIMDKPDWNVKIHNKEITGKWRQEIAQSGWDVSPAMMDYVFAELEWRATDYDGTVLAFDPGVVRSDTAVSEQLRQKLCDAVKPLEDVSEEKDYHPGSDSKVVDLVHPSLFPFVYGRTRVLRDTLIGIDDCFSHIGRGEVVEMATRAQAYNPEFRFSAGGMKPFSERFQWLPCDVEFNADGGCEITSYINNLHPAKHRGLYRVIEQVITQAIPLWNISLSEPYEMRIPYKKAEYPSDDEEPEPLEGEDYDTEAYEERYDAWRDNLQPKQPEPPKFLPPRYWRTNVVNLHRDFKDKGLQVIVKLANIELTPEKPEYAGGSWHIEGQLNERICATAIYYYDNENISSNTLSFRHRADQDYVGEVSYEQGQFEFLRVFGFNSDAGNDYGGSEFTQPLGDINCREGRLLTFPNTLQHRVSPFSLEDRSKPGHRKILALFLIDPHRKVISTASVPPQRDDWCEEWRSAVHDVLGRRLPVELQDMVQKNSAYDPMTLDEAKALRLELMEERSSKSKEFNKEFEDGGFSLCEH